jgi:hypothetical protein
MLRRRVYGLIRRHFTGLRKSQQTTTTELLVGLLAAGKLGLAAIARGMNDKTTVRYRIKRLWRFAQNHRIKVDTVMLGVVGWLSKKSDESELVIALDWTEWDDFCMLCASCAVGRRAVPVAWRVVTRRQFSKRDRSRNTIEETLIRKLQAAIGPRPWVLVADRGFARASLFKKLSKWHVRYVIRAASNVWVRSGRYSDILGNLPRKPRRAVRWAHVLYHKTQRVPVSLVMAHAEPAPEPWYLVTNVEGLRRVVNLYERRMWIEESFRDAKSRLGLNKLWLARPERIERLFILAALAMLMSVLVGLDHRRRTRGADPQLTTKRKGQTLSLFFLGLQLIRQHGLPPRLHQFRLFDLVNSV